MITWLCFFMKWFRILESAISITILTFLSHIFDKFHFPKGNIWKMYKDIMSEIVPVAACWILPFIWIWDSSFMQCFTLVCIDMRTCVNLQAVTSITTQFHTDAWQSPPNDCTSHLQIHSLLWLTSLLTRIDGKLLLLFRQIGGNYHYHYHVVITLHCL